jgi:hypothetical protein
MLIRLALLIVVTWLGTAHATDPRATKLMNIDKAACSEASSAKYTWLIHMTAWRESYNNCMRAKLKALGPKYIRSTLEAIRLESLCPESSLDSAPIDLSMMGIEIANGLTAREMQKSITSNTLEQTLELYYDRIIHSNLRIRELRR